MGNAGKAAGRVAGITLLSVMGAVTGLVLGCAGALMVIGVGDSRGWTPQGDAAVGFAFKAIAFGLFIGTAVGAVAAGAVARWLLRSGPEENGRQAEPPRDG